VLTNESWSRDILTSSQGFQYFKNFNKISKSTGFPEFLEFYKILKLLGCRKKKGTALGDFQYTEFKFIHVH